MELLCEFPDIFELKKDGNESEEDKNQEEMFQLHATNLLGDLEDDDFSTPEKGSIHHVDFGCSRERKINIGRHADSIPTFSSDNSPDSDDDEDKKNLIPHFFNSANDDGVITDPESVANGDVRGHPLIPSSHFEEVKQMMTREAGLLKVHDGSIKNNT